MPGCLRAPTRCSIYFDFSGYTDMAIGLARMFGVRLPVNFNSPYKADSISDFWRRWHMTLSRFLRDYLYIPLGGNRKGEPRRYLNLMITMLLGGLWHGANWTFMAWGGLHGIYLIINHAFSGRGRSPEPEKPALLRRSSARRHFRRRRRRLGLLPRGEFYHRRPYAGVHGRANGLDLQEIRDSHARWPVTILLLAFVMIAPNTQQVMAIAPPATWCAPADPT